MRIYSVVVWGIGEWFWNEAGMRRIEFLCFELMADLRRKIPQDHECLRRASEVVGCQPEALRLDICWAPHKLEYDGSTMKTTACGSNERSDFFVTRASARAPTPVILLDVYHTTNMPEGTFTHTYAEAIPEARLLARSSYVCCLCSTRSWKNTS